MSQIIVQRFFFFGFSLILLHLQVQILSQSKFRPRSFFRMTLSSASLLYEGKNHSTLLLPTYMIIRYTGVMYFSSKTNNHITIGTNPEVQDWHVSWILVNNKTRRNFSTRLYWLCRYDEPFGTQWKWNLRLAIHSG